MKRHWKNFYTEEDIKALSQRGVQRIILPIGDWTIKPYGPYIGCMDGSEQQTLWVLNTCSKYNIQVLI